MAAQSWGFCTSHFSDVTAYMVRRVSYDSWLQSALLPVQLLAELCPFGGREHGWMFRSVVAPFPGRCSAVPTCSLSFLQTEQILLFQFAKGKVSYYFCFSWTPRKNAAA